MSPSCYSGEFGSLNSEVGKRGVFSGEICEGNIFREISGKCLHK